MGEGPKSVERLDSLVWLESSSAGEAYGYLTNDNSMRSMVADGAVGLVGCERHAIYQSTIKYHFCPCY